jgi:hypothetical protein
VSPEALNLRDLEAALDGLDADLSPRSLEGLMHDVGGIVQSKWRDNIADAGLVETGQYLGSIAVVTRKKTDRFIQVAVQSDAHDEEGFPYPIVLEYGDATVQATPVGTQAFNQSRRRIVQNVSAELERKVRSRARR